MATIFSSTSAVDAGPYPDDFFDFVIASHILEDVRDPIHVVKEMSRVGKAGYVETPSRMRESFAKTRFYWLHRALGRVPDVGYDHHRWFVEAEGSHLRFTAKSFLVVTRRKFHLTRREFPKKFTTSQNSLAVFWEGGVTGEEVVLIERAAREDDLARFKATAASKSRRGLPGRAVAAVRQRVLRPPTETRVSRPLRGPEGELLRDLSTLRSILS